MVLCINCEVFLLLLLLLILKNNPKQSALVSVSFRLKRFMHSHKRTHFGEKEIYVCICVYICVCVNIYVYMCVYICIYV